MTIRPFICYSARDMREAADRLGSHFFTPSAMRFFNSRLLSPYFIAQFGGNSNPGMGPARPGDIDSRTGVSDHVAFFVTSERYSDETERRYTVRMVRISRHDANAEHSQPFDSIEFDTVSEFQEYATARAASNAAFAARNAWRSEDARQAVSL